MATKRYRRICLWGGPGAGKSTTAAWLFVAMRDMGLSVELAHEYVKKYAYKGYAVEGATQMKCFGKQVEIEATAIEAGVDLVISDSPLMLQAYYSRSRNESFWVHLAGQAKWIEEQWPSLNIFLDRKGIVYDVKGVTNPFDEAKKVDIEMVDFMHAQDIPYGIARTVNRDEVLSVVRAAMPDLIQ